MTVKKMESFVGEIQLNFGKIKIVYISNFKDSNYYMDVFDVF